jgi:hypothetical protein
MQLVLQVQQKQKRQQECSSETLADKRTSHQAAALEKVQPAASGSAPQMLVQHMCMQQ